MYRDFKTLNNRLISVKYCPEHTLNFDKHAMKTIMVERKAYVKNLSDLNKVNVTS